MPFERSALSDTPAQIDGLEPVYNYAITAHRVSDHERSQIDNRTHNDAAGAGPPTHVLISTTSAGQIAGDCYSAVSSTCKFALTTGSDRSPPLR